jgi:hypothetical protein
VPRHHLGLGEPLPEEGADLAVALALGVLVVGEGGGQPHALERPRVVVQPALEAPGVAPHLDVHAVGCVPMKPPGTP